ncbi:hypothetical protein AB0D32_23865 [Micromonospora sp. NPDC048170]|uniref:hypothetical protein n=1 Tax=Micromonospora sp. NPDC048170 TaxID=3154819 RepID=UPI0033EA2C1F
MAMSEAFAATAVQTIPVLALAAVLEYRTSVDMGRGYMLAYLLRSSGQRFDGWKTGRSGFIAGAASGLWTMVMFACVPAEALAVYRLQGHALGAVSEIFVSVTIVATMALLVVYPLLMRIADALQEIQNARTAPPLHDRKPTEGQPIEAGVGDAAE